jgi:hypothetical protein
LAAAHFQTASMKFLVFADDEVSRRNAARRVMPHGTKQDSLATGSRHDRYPAIASHQEFRKRFACGPIAIFYINNQRVLVSPATHPNH